MKTNWQQSEQDINLPRFLNLINHFREKEMTKRGKNPGKNDGKKVNFFAKRNSKTRIKIKIKYIRLKNLLRKIKRRK